MLIYFLGMCANRMESNFRNCLVVLRCQEKEVFVGLKRGAIVYVRCDGFLCAGLEGCAFWLSYIRETTMINCACCKFVFYFFLFRLVGYEHFKTCYAILSNLVIRNFCLHLLHLEMNVLKRSTQLIFEVELHIKFEHIGILDLLKRKLPVSNVSKSYKY